jgi:hypothetical protein
MRITKDEAAILYEALKDAKFELCLIYDSYDELAKLENRLYFFSKDNRRNGRKSHDTFKDKLIRFTNKQK